MSEYNYFIPNKVLFEKCDKGKKYGSNLDCYYFLFENKAVKRLVQWHAFACPSPGRRPNDK